MVTYEADAFDMCRSAVREAKAGNVQAQGLCWNIVANLRRTSVLRLVARLKNG